MIDLFEKHTLRHYFYLRDTYPLLVPHLQMLCNDNNTNFDDSSKVSEGTSRSHAFLLGIFERVGNVMSLENASNEIQSAILEHSVRYIYAFINFLCHQTIYVFVMRFNYSKMKFFRDLQRLGEVEPKLCAASKFLCSYLQCQMSLRRVCNSTDIQLIRLFH
jgi:hypothetical protein